MYDEDLTTVSKDSWRGMRLGELQEMYDGIAAHIKMTWVMALTMQQTLQNVSLPRPNFVRQHGLPQRFGSCSMKAMEGLMREAKETSEAEEEQETCDLLWQNKRGKTRTELDECWKLAKPVSIGGLCVDNTSDGKQGVKMEDRKVKEMEEYTQQVGEQQQKIIKILQQAGRVVDKRESTESNDAVWWKGQNVKTGDGSVSVQEEESEKRGGQKVNCGKLEEAFWRGRHVKRAPSWLKAEDAEKLLINAAKALIAHEESENTKVQASHDPGVQWMDEHGVLMEECLKYLIVWLARRIYLDRRGPLNYTK